MLVKISSKVPLINTFETQSSLTFWEAAFLPRDFVMTGTRVVCSKKFGKSRSYFTKNRMRKCKVEQSLAVRLEDKAWVILDMWIPCRV